MKIRKKIILISLLAGLLCVYFGGQAFASEGADNWRHTYDLVMKWLNFGILAFVIYKFGKPPLMNFLHGQKDLLVHEIGSMENEKSLLDDKVKKIQDILDQGESYYTDLKERIVRQGEKRREELIEEARIQSKIMMEASKQKINNHIIQAKENFKAEMIDAAIDMASKKLPNKITDDDNQNFIDNYFAGIVTK